MASSWLYIAFAAIFSIVSAQDGNGPATVPEFVLQYAPLVYMDINEQYYPSDIGAQLQHTHVLLNTSNLNVPEQPLSLNNLSSYNSLGNCSWDDIGGCSLYLTSLDPVPINPPSPDWQYGVLPNPETGATDNATSCAVVVTDHGNGTVDAFYFYFYAFNHGQFVPAIKFLVDDHVGDWEHNMIRFRNGQPESIWYSQHTGGKAYTFDTVSKQGLRPVAYSSLGGHATYATPGFHDLYGGLAGDNTSAGPLWDPIRSAWFYSFTPQDPGNFTATRGTFAALSPNGCPSNPPTDWLTFFGRWGDKQYPADHPGQNVIGSIGATFEDGPTGPVDKDLNRMEVCPDDTLCISMSTLPAVTSGATSQTVSRSYLNGMTSSSGMPLATDTMYAACSSSAAPTSNSSGGSAPSGSGSDSGSMPGSASPSPTSGSSGINGRVPGLSLLSGIGLLVLLV